MQSSATRLSRLITSAADKHKDKQDDNDVGSPQREKKWCLERAISCGVGRRG